MEQREESLWSIKNIFGYIVLCPVHNRLGIQQFQNYNMKSPTKNQYNSAKSSRSIISKSSKLTKINNETEQKKAVSPYFQQNSIRSQLLTRISFVSSKQKSERPDHLQKAENIMMDLMNRHQKAKQKLQKMKQQSERCYDKIHPFAPKIQSNKERFAVKGNVIRRNQIWLRQKNKHNLELKQQITIENLKECTFSPDLKSKKKSEMYLRQKQTSRSIGRERKTLYQKNDNFDFSPNRPKYQEKKHKYETQSGTPNKGKRKQYTEAQYESAKQNLISRMMNISY